MFYLLCFSYSKKNQFGKSTNPRFIKAKDQDEFYTHKHNHDFITPWKDPKYFTRKHSKALPMEEPAHHHKTSHQRPRIYVSNNYTSNYTYPHPEDGEKRSKMMITPHYVKPFYDTSKEKFNYRITPEESRIIRQRIEADYRRREAQRHRGLSMCMGVQGQASPECKQSFYCVGGPLTCGGGTYGIEPAYQRDGK